MPHTIDIVLGTRPEAVKMAPVIAAFRDCPDDFAVRVLSTGQHKEMLTQILDSFDLRPDRDLEVMRPGSSLAEMTADTLRAMDQEIDTHRPDLLLVQGDTTTVLAAALAAFYRRVPVGHVEAGLRSHDLQNPFPEEANRRLVSILTGPHFAPTESAAAELLAERIPPENIAVTGNTVVDALLHFEDKLGPLASDIQSRLLGRRMILVTAHRRESWGQGLENICRAVESIVQDHPDVIAVFPVHANPLVQQTAQRILGRHDRIVLLPSVPYLDFVRLMHQAELILTDSGGVQEEAPSFGVPVLVTRDVTERAEAVNCGLARLVGTDPQTVIQAAGEILARTSRASRIMRRTGNPFGDGRASRRIVLAAKRFLTGQRPLLSGDEAFIGTCSET
ncbi:non-hydrolyzing UDP-N-acetylglucosamine 2-epimerase [Desulfonatronum sp. SC1]|uniref:non-hydrolyzing UDP-N-acetylglucosamine 2-epimerase n=1 Tax=Desulfonatronum sp. SC1 TaxID=2109626 RepID=UPI000D30D4B2|nr:UDP-N-acetylglucosamine 2-epimerase (non-hydrolyzing) [Desulfonatronum sp. SC1]PTN37508.1 UDP-N-acetylglucosamine 2-epimerase (non-hydrolyzing) [Desulfonatronum sp. SC1]